MAPFATITSWENDYRVARVKVIAKLNGLDLQEASDFKLGVTNKSADFLAKFPLGKVPVLETADGFHLAESAAMATYMAAAGPKADQLLGADPKTKSKIAEWAFFSDSEINSNSFYVLTTAVVKFYPADPARYQASVANFEKALGKIQAALKAGDGKFLVGGALTFADLMVSAPLFFSSSFLIDGKMRADYPAVVKYLEGLLTIPEVKEFFEIQECAERPKLS